MKISELSAATAVPIPTVKYYLREGLLPHGEATAHNQAQYGDEHVRRLRLVRVLVEIGHLGIAEVRNVIAALDDDRHDLHETFGVAQDALIPALLATDEHERQAARTKVDGWLERRGWTVRADARVRDLLADAVIALERAGWDEAIEAFDGYADLVDPLAAFEVASIDAGQPSSRVLEDVVVGTVAFDVALSALRRMALEHHSAARFRPGAVRT